MKWRTPRFWIAVSSAALVLTLALASAERTSPGPLATVHGRIPEMDGGESCSQCHGGWFESMTEACLECHEVIGIQIDERQGLHGALSREKATNCAACHSEHHGADFAMVNRQSFAQAGVPDPEKFDHELVGFAMDGKHLEIDCSECHVHARDAVLQDGAWRFGGLDQNCATCHEDPHEGRMELACADCHGQRAFDELAPAGHDEFLPLVGGHGDVACIECHKEDGPRSLEALRHGRGPAPRTCVACHDSPHREDFLGGIAKLVQKKTGESCVACHVAQHTSFRDEALEMTPEQHARSGFALDAPHDEVACAECHTSDRDTFAARYPGRGADQCQACHEDPHDGQFEKGPFAEQGCVGCHDRHRFEPHAFDVKKHARTALPLTGSHLEMDCNACHKVPHEKSPRVFQGTPSDCAGCHADAHRGYFKKVAPDCAQCHATTKFSEVSEKTFDHGRWTRFAIEGAHAQTDCESCHKRTRKPDRFGRSFGRVAKQFGKYKGCVTCHIDPHQGTFDAPHLPKKVDGETGCARCHVETSFRAFPKEFQHGPWTGFALKGRHAKINCAECHTPRRKPDKFGRTWGAAKGSRCADCHEDPHNGQFVRNGVISCQRCHNSALQFADLSFRHELDSRFRLGEAHKKVACNACHKPVRFGDLVFTRYRPMGRECSDCHGPLTDPLRRGKGK